MITSKEFIEYERKSYQQCEEYKPFLQKVCMKIEIINRAQKTKTEDKFLSQYRAK